VPQVRRVFVLAPIAVLQLLYAEAVAAEWLFSQEKAALHDLKMATSIGEPLYPGIAQTSTEQNHPDNDLALLCPILFAVFCGKGGAFS
jgi:hypothetical protein